MSFGNALRSARASAHFSSWAACRLTHRPVISPCLFTGTYSDQRATAENGWPCLTTVTFAAAGGSFDSQASVHWPSSPHHTVSS